MTSGQVGLSGAQGDPVPRFVNEQMQVDANDIDMNVEGSRMKASVARGACSRSCFRPSPARRSRRRTPRLMQQDQPVNGVSRELSYIGGEQSTVEFIGPGSLCRGRRATRR